MTILQVTGEDSVQADEIFIILMGDQVEPICLVPPEVKELYEKKGYPREVKFYSSLRAILNSDKIAG